MTFSKTLIYIASKGEFLYKEGGGSGWDPDTVRCYCHVELALLSEVAKQVFVEVYRDNIPKQSKLANSISFYGTIELWFSFKKLIIFCQI